MSLLYAWHQKSQNHERHAPQPKAVLLHSKHGSFALHFRRMLSMRLFSASTTPSWRLLQ